MAFPNIPTFGVPTTFTTQPSAKTFSFPSASNSSQPASNSTAFGFSTQSASKAPNNGFSFPSASQTSQPVSQPVSQPAFSFPSASQPSQPVSQQLTIFPQSVINCIAFANKGIKVDYTKIFTDFMKKISQNNNHLIVYLRNPEVIKWLIGDVSFLGPPQCDPLLLEKMENSWGSTLMNCENWFDKLAKIVYLECCHTSNTCSIVSAQKGEFSPMAENENGVFFLYAKPYYSDIVSNVFSDAFKFSDTAKLYGKPVFVLGFGGVERDMVKNNMIGTTGSANPLVEGFNKANIIFMGIGEIIRKE